MNRQVAIAIGFVAAYALGIFLVMPAPISPLGYTPPRKPAMVGPLAPNAALSRAELIARGQINGPEDVAVDSRGRMYAGTGDGRIVRIDPAGAVSVVAETGGRPLGLMFDAAGDLIVCDADRGLLRVSPAGGIRVLATEAGGVPFRFTDDLDIASDGRIYFTDASDTYGQQQYLFDLLEARPHGRLLRYDPGTGQTAVLLDHLYFANGVALSHDERFVLVNETYRYRITRYWLKGARRGEHEIFADNLPGFPDNINSDRQGRFYLALFTVRNDLMDRLHPHPWLKSLLSKLPRALWPKPLPYGLVLVLDENGRVQKSFHEPSGDHLREITSATPHAGSLYLGSLHNDRIGRFPLP